MSCSARYVIQVVLALVFVLVTAHAARYVAGLTNPVLEFDVGPSTGSYLDGFTESEERVPVTFRWTRERASIALPLAAEGPEAVLRLSASLALSTAMRRCVCLSKATSRVCSRLARAAFERSSFR